MGCNCGGPRKDTVQPAKRDRRTNEPIRPTRERRVATAPGEAGFKPESGFYQGPKKTEKSV